MASNVNTTTTSRRAYIAPNLDFENALRWTCGDRYYLQASQKAFQDMFETKNKLQKEPVVELTSVKLTEIGRLALKKGDLLIAEKCLEKAIRKEKLETAERNSEAYFYLAEVLEGKAAKPDVGLLQRQKILLQAAALLNFVRNCSENRPVDGDISKKLLKAVPRKIQDIQDALVLSVEGNPVRSKFDSESKRKMLEKLRKDARCSLESIQSKYNEEEAAGEEYLRSVFVGQSSEIRTLFKSIAFEIKRLLAEIIQECLEVLGKPPCDYEILVLGSLAREEMTPYSDLEWAILTSSEDEECKVFFHNLTNLVHLQIINLGETILPSMDIQALNNEWFYDDVTPRGVSFDGFLPQACKTPLGNVVDFELIHSPVKMAEFQNKFWCKKNPGLGEIMLTVAPLNGDSHLLLDEYKIELEKFLRIPCDSDSCDHDVSSGKQPSRGACRGLKTLKEDVSRYGEMMSGSEQMNDGKLYDVKKEIYRLTDRVLAGLAKYFHVDSNGAFDILGELCNRGIIQSIASDNLASAVGIALKLRLSTYLQAGKQQEEMKPKTHDEATPSISDSTFTYHMLEEKELFHFFYVTIPLYEELHRFCDEDEDHSGFLSQDVFFDCSDIIKGHAYCRLLNYAEASQCYDRAFEDDPGNMDLEIRRIRMAFLTNDSKELVMSTKRRLDAILRAVGRKYSLPESIMEQDVAKCDHNCGNLVESFPILRDDRQLVEILYLSSNVCQMQGDFEKAQVILGQCWEMVDRFHLGADFYLVIALSMLQSPLNGASIEEERFQAIISRLSTLIDDEGISVRGIICLNSLGEVLLRQGKYDEAYHCLQRSLAMGRVVFGMNINFHVVGTVMLLGKASMVLSKYGESKYYFQQVLHLLQDSSGKVQLILIKEIYRLLSTIFACTNRPAEAILYLQKGFASMTSSTVADFTMDCMMHCTMAICWHDLDNSEKAWQCASDANECLKKITDEHIRVTLACTVAETYLKVGKNEEALNSLKQELLDMDSQTDDVVKVQYLSSLGELCKHQGLVMDSEQYYKRALEIQRCTKDNMFDIVKNLLAISNILLENGKSSEAVGYVEEAWKYTSTETNRDEKCKFLRNIAECWKKLDNVYRARKCLEEALEICTESVVNTSKVPFIECTVHIELGNLAGDVNSLAPGISTSSEQVNQAKRIHYDRAGEVLRRHSTSGNFDSTTILLFTYLSSKYHSIDLTEKENLLLEALEMSDDIHGSADHVNEVTADILIALCDVYCEKEDYAIASDFLDRCLKMEIEMHSSDPYHQHISHGISSLSTLYMTSRSNKQLEDVLKRVLDFIERAGNEEDTSSDSAAKANCFVSIAYLFVCLGDLERAESFNNMACELFAAFVKNPVPTGVVLNDGGCETMKKLVGLLKSRPMLQPLLKTMISSGLLGPLFHNTEVLSSSSIKATGIANLLLNRESTELNRPSQVDLSSERDMPFEGENLSSTSTMSENPEETTGRVSQNVPVNLALTNDSADTEVSNCSALSQTETKDAQKESSSERKNEESEDSAGKEERVSSGNETETDDVKGFKDSFSSTMNSLNLLKDSMQYDLNKGNFEKAAESLKVCFQPLMMSFIEQHEPDAVQYFLNEAFQARDSYDTISMATSIGMASKYPSNPKTKARLSKLGGDCHIYQQNYRMAVISFTEAVGIYKSNYGNTALELDVLVQYAECLIGLTRSRLLCNEVQDAWNTCLGGMELVAATEPGAMTSRPQVELLYLAAKCTIKLNADSSTPDVKNLEQAASFCLQALSAIEVVDQVMGCSDLIEELGGWTRGEFFSLKCEIRLLHATTLLMLEKPEAAQRIVTEMSEFLGNVAVVFETFSKTTWPGGEVDFFRIQRRLYSWIGQALVLSGEKEAAAGPLTKSLAAFLIPIPASIMQPPQEEILALFDALTASNSSAASSQGESCTLHELRHTLERCKLKFIEQRIDLKELLSFLGSLGNHYGDCGRTEEAVVVYETGLAIAECMVDHVQDSHKQMLLYLAGTHTLQAIKNAGKGTDEERRLAEGYYSPKRNSAVITSKDRVLDVLYANFLLQGKRFKEAIPVLDRVTGIGDKLWHEYIIISYFRRILYSPDVQQYIEAHGQLLTSTGNLAYSMLVQVYVAMGMKREAVDAYERLSTSGREIKDVVCERSPYLPYLLGFCQKCLLSLVEDEGDLHFDDSDFPLAEAELAQVYYKFGEYELSLQYSNKARLSMKASPAEPMSNESESLRRFQGELLTLRLAGNSLVMLGRGNESYSYFVPFLQLLHVETRILDEPLDKRNGILAEYSFADDYYLYRALGIILAGQGKINGAIECAEHCLYLDQDCNNQSLVATLSELYQSKAYTEGRDDESIFQKWIKKALGCFEKLLGKQMELEPFVEAAFACLLCRIERPQEAVPRFEHVLSISDDTTSISFSDADKPLLSVYLCRELEARGSVELPLKVYVLSEMSLTYFKLGEVEKARESVLRMEAYTKRFVPKPPYVSLILSVLGYTYKELGNSSKAVEIFKDVLKMEPDHDPVNIALHESHESCTM